MEHILLPEGTQLDADDVVPYVAARQYDRGPFLSYPERVQLSHIISAAGMVPYTVKNGTADSIDAELQEWCFFGLLHEVFGSSFDAASFIRQGRVEDVARAVINTSTLVSDLDAWSEQVQTTQLHDDKEYCHRLARCMKLVEILLQAPAPRNHASNIRLCIATTVELVFTVTNNTFSNQARDGALNYFPDGISFIANKRIAGMVTRGWCPYDASILPDIFVGASTLVFASKVIRMPTPRDHSACEEKKCSASVKRLQLAKGPTHRRQDCTCDVLTVDQDQLRDILLKDGIPLARLCSAAKQTLRLHRWDGKEKFVALSHVWADGLGNPADNAIHKCQAEFIASLLGNLDNGLEVQQSGSCLFWLDTLCCPAQNGEAKTKALGRMRQTYLSASHVLVLDAELLYLTSASLSTMKFAVYLLTSGWMRRLWTLQEGCFARQLFIQCADVALPLAKLLKDIMSLASENQAQPRLIALNLFQAMIQLTFKYTRNASQDDSKGLALAVLKAALRHRSTSKETDEPICAGTLLGLDVETIARASGLSARMQDFWTQTSNSWTGIPPAIIFNTAQRLSMPGFRWAPSTLLSNDRSRSLVVAQEQLASLTPNGLSVRFPGLILSFETMIRCEHSGQRWPDAIHATKDGHQLLLRLKTNQWASINSWSGCEWQLHNTINTMTDLDQSFAVILLQDPSVSTRTPALFARVLNSSDRTAAVQTICPVEFEMSESITGLVLEASYSVLIPLFQLARTKTTFTEAVTWILDTSTSTPVINMILSRLGLEETNSTGITTLRDIMRCLTNGSYGSVLSSLSTTYEWHVD